MDDRPDEPADADPAGAGPDDLVGPDSRTASDGGTGAGARLDDVAQVHRALGRYPQGRPDRVLYSAVALVLLVPGALAVAAGTLLALPVLVLGVLVALLGWAVPATVVDRTGFRRGRFLRHVPWSAVTTVYRPPRGGDVQVGLRNGRVLRLDGVKADRVAGVVLLAHAAAPTTSPGPPSPAA